MLRYAVTREPSDRSAALAMADELDALGGSWRPVAPRFFLRTSQEVCGAIVSFGDAHSNAVLRRHAMRIQHTRMRRTFQAAIGQEWILQQGDGINKRRKDEDLWKGLPAKRNVMRPL